MFTEPKIITTNDLGKRSYILYYFDGARHREYNGKSLGLKIYPNKSSTLIYRNKALAKLLFEFKKALESGFNPSLRTINDKTLTITNSEPSSEKTIQDIFKEVEREKINSPISERYKRELKIIVIQFLTFLHEKEKSDLISNLSVTRIEMFLNQFNSSGTYYSNKRRTLAVFFSEFHRKKYIADNLVRQTPRAKSKATLHKIYSQDQLKKLIIFLKANHPNLYIMALLSYGCLLRPHREIRFLKKKHFNEDFTFISLSGSENKSSRVRVVPVPNYVQNALNERLNSINDPETNIFTLLPTAFNEFYFNLCWTRLRSDMIKSGLLQKEQTIYSFRHTSAVDIYKRTKDIYLLQQLLGHSTMIVTLKYLRGLGQIDMRDLKNALPVLDI